MPCEGLVDQARTVQVRVERPLPAHRPVRLLARPCYVQCVASKHHIVAYSLQALVKVDMVTGEIEPGGRHHNATTTTPT